MIYRHSPGSLDLVWDVGRENRLGWVGNEVETAWRGVLRADVLYVAQVRTQYQASHHRPAAKLHQHHQRHKCTKNSRTKNANESNGKK